MSWIPRVANDPPMLIPAWTLSCEMFFYLCFPFLFKWMRKAPFKLIVTVLCLGLLWPFSTGLVLPPDGGGLWWFHSWFPPVRIGEFLAGMAFAFLVPAFKPVQGLFGTVLGFLAPLANWVTLSYLPLPAPLDGALDSAIILGWFFYWMNPTQVVDKVFGNKTMVLLGAASYSLYLLHGPLFRYIVRLPIGLTDERIRGTVLDFWLYAILVVLASIAAYKGIEAPAQKWLRRLFKERRPEKVAAPKPSGIEMGKLSSKTP
jgi:peptidoglycan/LPS O-acetylase OafA/YrhL